MFALRTLLVCLFAAALSHSDLEAAPKVATKIANVQLPSTAGLDLSRLPQFGSQRRTGQQGGEQRQQPGTPQRKGGSGATPQPKKQG